MQWGKGRLSRVDCPTLHGASSPSVHTLATDVTVWGLPYLICIKAQRQSISLFTPSKGRKGMESKKWGTPNLPSFSCGKRGGIGMIFPSINWSQCFLWMEIWFDISGRGLSLGWELLIFSLTTCSSFNVEEQNLHLWKLERRDGGFCTAAGGALPDSTVDFGGDPRIYFDLNSLNSMRLF